MSPHGPAPLERYRRSLDQLARAEAVIPLGSQTFSKSRTALPIGASPLFIERGAGSHVWDVDGNEYIDFMSGLLAISLGYNDPDVNAAVRAQLEQGVIFSLPHPIETEVAERIVELVPCAELVRFGKNGSDATAGAIRVARAYTGRDRVAVCGYHGWQDWYIGSTTRDLGVPAATKALTHPFRYNDVALAGGAPRRVPGRVRGGDPRADEHHLAATTVFSRASRTPPADMARSSSSTRPSPGFATRWAAGRSFRRDPGSGDVRQGRRQRLPAVDRRGGATSCG